MSNRPVIESARVVIRDEDGNRLEVETKGNVAEGMVLAFIGLSAPRRTKLLEQLQTKHQEMLGRGA